MKLLVAYDGSPGAAAALTDLEHAGLPPNVHATVLSVADVWLPPEGSKPDPAPPEWLAKAFEQNLRERLQTVEQMRSEAVSAAERLRRAFPAWTIEAEACGDSPAWGILKRAEELRSDLIVVGSQGLSTVERFFLGSVSLKVLNAALCSVRIGRPRRADSHAGLRLLIGVDGSNHALRAVEAVKKRHWPPGTSVRLVSILNASTPISGISPHDRINAWVYNTTEGETWAHQMVSDLANEVRETGLQAEGVVLSGYPKGILVEESERWGADCLFVGSQGLNAVERAVLGSVSSAVAARAPCSVEVVRA